MKKMCALALATVVLFTLWAAWAEDEKDIPVLENAEHHVSIQDVWLSNAEDYVYVALAWFHETEEALNFWLTVTVEAYQDETELMRVFLPEDLDVQLEEVKASVVQEVRRVFALTDSEADLEILLKIPSNPGLDELRVTYPLEALRRADDE